MKLQTLTVIFIIIILPIILTTSFYITTEVKAVNQQTKYDTMLTNCSYDAMKAFQLNENNANTSDVTSQKMRNVQASVNTFYNSLSLAMDVEGYTQTELKSYIPCLIYVMYDGYYVSVSKDDYNTELLPYTYYTETVNTSSGEYTICYTLDNYVYYYGGKEYTYNSGYLTTNDSNDINQWESLTENVVLTIEYEGTDQNADYEKVCVQDCPYVISDCTGQAKKYYRYKDKWYTNYSTTGDVRVYEKIEEDLEKAVKNDLKDMSAVNYLQKGDTENFTEEFSGIFGSSSHPYFNIKVDNNPDDYSSAFNEHRREVIKNSIQSAMKSSIKNYSNGSEEFKMPELPETEWDKIINNVSLISFMEGLPLKSKLYMGYSVVTNTKSKEFVNPSEFYVICNNDSKYYKITSKDLNGNDNIKGIYRNIDFDSKNYTTDSGTQSKYLLHGYFPEAGGSSRILSADYGSIVSSSNVYEKLSDMFIDKTTGKEKNSELKKAYYTALYRERFLIYKSNK